MYKFFTPPSDALMCLICHEVADEPWQHDNCGKLFCRECIEKYGKKKPCPGCRMGYPLYFKDNKSRREIRELSVRCNNVDNDCQWEGTVSTLEKHVNVCEFTLVPCPKECKDDNGILKIMRRDLQQHLMEKCPNRDYSCEHCDLKGTYATTLDHYDTCEKKIITCTNEECTMEMERMKLSNHLSEECKHTMISCKYNSIGCDVKLKIEDMRAHEQDDKAHLNKALDTIVELKEKIYNSESMIFKVTGFQNKKDNDVCYDSPSFYTSPNGYNMKISMYANSVEEDKGSHVSVFVHFEEGKYDDEQNWPFVGDVTIKLLNQLEDKNHYSEVLQLTPNENTRVDDNWGNPQYIPHSKLSRDSASNTQYLKDDTLYFRISVEVSDQKPWLWC